MDEPWTERESLRGMNLPVNGRTWFATGGRIERSEERCKGMIEDSADWITVADASAVAPGTVLGVKTDDLHVAIYNIDGEFYAMHDVCTHAEALLSDGWLEEDIIECPLHGGRFEVRTGKGLGPPIMCDVETVPLRVVDNKIQIKPT